MSPVAERPYAPETTEGFTIPDLLGRRAAVHPKRIAINVDDGPTMTYLEWDHRSNAVAHGLVEAGVQRGQVVGLLFDGLDWIDYAMAYLGALKAGATAIHLSYVLGVGEVVRRLTWCSASCVIHGASIAPPAEFSGLAGTVKAFTSSDTGKVSVPVDVTDIADILFTSGTTGLAKASTSPHGNLTHGRGPEGFYLFGDPEPLLAPMSLGTTASATTVNFSVHTPSTLVMCSTNDPERMGQLIEKLHIRSIMLTPWLAIQLIRARVHERYDLTSVETMANASNALPPAHARKLLEIMPNARLNMSYAASEAVPASIGHSFDPSKPLATGRPVGRTQLRIVDDRGETVPVGEVGEIWLRSPAPKRYYFNDPALNERVHVDGWTRTGDLGRVDKEGLLYCLDRRNTAIRSGGRLISTIEVEAALYEHPAVEEAAVFALPLADGIDAVAAAVVLSDPGALAELVTFVARILAPEQVPSRLFAVGSMPRSTNGKVVKHLLREQISASALSE